MKKGSHSTVSNIAFYFKKQWLYSKASVILLLINIPITLLKTYLVVVLPKVAISLAINKSSFNHIVNELLFVGGALLFVNLVDYVINKYKSPFMLKYRYGMINEKVKKAYYTDYVNLEDPSFKNLMSRADKSLWGSGKGSIVEQMTSLPVSLLTSILSYVLFGSILGGINLWVAVILTCTSLVNYYSLKFCREYLHGHRDEISKIDRKMSYVTRNCTTFEGAADIRIYNMSIWFKQIFNKLCRERIEYEKKHSWKTYIANIIDVALILIRDGMAYAILIYMVLQNKLSIDNFVLGFAAVGTFASTIGNIISTVSNINQVSLTAGDLRDYLSYEENDNRLEGVSIPKCINACSIEINNVSYRYADAEVDILSDINLKINAGEKIAIVGLNGAGKTTLVKLICGLYNPTQGEILINGSDKHKYNIYDYYSLFAAVFQDYHLLPTSIACNVSSKDEQNTNREKVVHCLKLANLWDKIEQLPYGIDTPLNKQLNKDAIELSGGEKQKLILARAIYKNAPILVLDEPTAALDPIAEDKLYRSYNDITKDKTSIFISHRLASTRFCDRIVFIENGKIAEIGTHDELLMKNGKYAELYKVQSEYYH